MLETPLLSRGYHCFSSHYPGNYFYKERKGRSRFLKKSMTKKPNLNFWHIGNISFGFLEFSSAGMQRKYARDFTKLGANPMPSNPMLAGPYVFLSTDFGAIVRDWNWLGRRRP